MFYLPQIVSLDQRCGTTAKLLSLAQQCTAELRAEVHERIQSTISAASEDTKASTKATMNNLHRDVSLQLQVRMLPSTLAIHFMYEDVFILHTCIHIHAYIHTYIHTYLRTYIHTYIYIQYINICIHTYIYSTYLHTCIHTYMEMYMHMHSNAHTIVFIGMYPI